MSKPHASWAHGYDQLYEKSFGFFYSQLTQQSLDTIEQLTSPTARIIDFGAGTGRLAVPLAKSGRFVTAVEPCAEMLQVLKSKTKNLHIDMVNCTMANFKSAQPYDFATCVFTVLLYLTDENELNLSLKSVASSLKPSGQLLLDIPTKALFQSFRRKGSDFDRNVVIKPLGNDLFQYSENSRLTYENSGEHLFVDNFQIKYWSPEVVLSYAFNCGFTLQKDLSDEFSGTGSNYFLLRLTNDS
jgi:SAM-dependent methyltransferase